jgi:mono/diheme cytochrome c family protein
MVYRLASGLLWIGLFCGLVATTAAVAEDRRSGQPGAKARSPDEIFATTCGWCHHKGGREAGKGPRLMGTTLTDAEIIGRIRKGKQGFMPGFEGTFSDEEIKGLVAYIRGLKP